MCSLWHGPVGYACNIWLSLIERSNFLLSCTPREKSIRESDLIVLNYILIQCFKKKSYVERGPIFTR